MYEENSWPTREGLTIRIAAEPHETEAQVVGFAVGYLKGLSHIEDLLRDDPSRDRFQVEVESRVWEVDTEGQWTVKWTVRVGLS